MKEYVIPIWKAVDKFDNPSRLVYGERLKIAVRKPKGRKNWQIAFMREFKDYFEWHPVEDGLCRVTVNRKVMKRIVEALESMRRELYGNQADGLRKA